MATQYRIGEFADMSGVSAKTLRFYDEIGLLRPAGVDPRTNYRRYVPQQLEELAAILSLREMGASLAEIRALRRSGSNAERRKILDTLKGSAQQSMEAAAKVLHWVNAELEDLDHSERPVPVVVKRRPAIWIASHRARVDSYAEIEHFERELLSVVPTEAAGGVRGTLWHSCADADFLEGEPFVAIKHTLPPKSAYDLRQLPAATLACAYSKNDNRSAELAYHAISKWMRIRGYRLAGPKREICLDQLLEIQFPLKSA
jgi:DNA-binding transcriptional MerR regulator